MEQKYVNDVYDKIADIFSATRYKVWPDVATFLDSCSDGLNCLEIGCGNGKNMLHNKKLKFVGIDMCSRFVELCNLKGLRTFKADCCELPFKESTFDVVISIATFHHLSTPERRTQAIKQMVMVMKSGGKGLITVWSYENQPNQRFTKGDNFVPWKPNTGVGIINYRYYHIYTRDMVDELIGHVFISNVQIWNDTGNWYITFSKL